MSVPFESIMDEVERRSGEGIKRLENALGESFVSMIHPKTGVVVPVIATSQHVLKNLVKGFVLVLNSETHLCAQLTVDYDLLPEAIRRKREKEEADRDAIERGIHGEGENAELQLSREDGDEGAKPSTSN